VEGTHQPAGDQELNLRIIRDVIADHRAAD